MKTKDDVNQIIHYDFADLSYSSFFLRGFHDNEGLLPYRFSVTKAAPPIANETFGKGPWDDILFSMCLFRVKRANEEFYICIDTHDSCRANGSVGNGYHLPLLETCKYYFKVNYNPETIHETPELRRHRDRIIPVGPFFPIQVPHPWRYFPSLFGKRPNHGPSGPVRKRLGQLKSFSTVEEIERLRRRQKEWDVYFVVPYYNKHVHRDENEFRYRVLQAIRKQRRIHSFVGFVGDEVPEKYSEFHVRRFPDKVHLANMASSRVGIYVRGVHNCLSYKFGQLLALGVPVMGQTVWNNKPMIMSNRFFDLQFAFDRPEEIVEKAVAMLETPAKLKEIGASNAEVFDTQFAPAKAVGRILSHVFN